MNIRTKKKILKQKNRKVLNTILKKISQQFKLKNVKFGNGYFVFYHGEGAVCHFGIKETPDWRYGIWLFGKEPIVFGEHCDLIDKFKPSRTYLSTSDIDKFIKDVKGIVANPDLYLADSIAGGIVLDYDECITQEAYVKSICDEHRAAIQRERDNDYTAHHKVFQFFKDLLHISDDIVAVAVKDGNRRGWVCHPRYTIDLLVKPGISQEALDDLWQLMHQKVEDLNNEVDKLSYHQNVDFGRIYDNPGPLEKATYKYTK